MALTRDFRETVVARAKRDPAFKTALLQEALQAFLDGEVAPGLILLRDCINATVGFAALSKETHIPEKSLMRMVGPRGNPTASNLFAMVAALQHQTHVETHVETLAAEVKTRPLRQAIRHVSGPQPFTDSLRMTKRRRQSRRSADC
jgi:DNA-binding phage protein